MAALHGIRRLLLTCLGLVVLSSCVTQSAPTPAPGATSSPQAPVVSPTPLPSAPPTAQVTVPPSLASRPFTVLLLGGDLEFRTDAIMVVGVDPVNRTLAFVSIPRDTIDVPLPGGGIFANHKINAFYDAAAGDPTHYPQGPGRATADLVGTLLGIHIDFYAATSFAGFKNLVHAMSAIAITLANPVVDPNYQVTTTNIGIRFPAGPQQLDPDRALIFVRTRQGDNDFARERRQQLFLLAAGQQLVQHPELFALLLAAQSNLTTDFPLLEIPNLLAVVGAVAPSGIRQAVLGPTRYESAGSCTCGYALEPNVPEMRKLAAAFFPWAVAP